MGIEDYYDMFFFVFFLNQNTHNYTPRRRQTLKQLNENIKYTYLLKKFYKNYLRKKSNYNNL